MKHHDCPHCGVYVPFRQRWLPRNGEVHCAQCGGVSYLVPGAFWSVVNVTWFGLVMAVQHWYRQPGWIVAVIVLLYALVLTSLSPLRILSRGGRLRQIAMAAATLLAYILVNEWGLAHRPIAEVPAVPAAQPSPQSAWHR